MANKKGEDPAPYYGLSSTWVDENGKIQSDYHLWVQNRPNHEIEYFGKSKGWMPEHRKHGKWAVRYDNPQAVEEDDEDPVNELLVEPIEEFDPTLIDDEENILPDPVLTQQDLRNQDAYYLGYSKHMIEAHQRFDNKKWWQWWIKEDDFPKYPIEQEPVSKDKYGRIYITQEVYERIQKWDEEIERKKKPRIF